MTKEGFLLLTSSYRGDKALQTKIKMLSEIDIPQRPEIEFMSELTKFLEEQLLPYELQYKVLDYRLDCYIPLLNFVIEYDEQQHQYSEKADRERENAVKRALCGADNSIRRSVKFIRLSYKDSHAQNLAKVAMKLPKSLRFDDSHKVARKFFDKTWLETLPESEQDLENFPYSIYIISKQYANED